MFRVEVEVPGLTRCALQVHAEFSKLFEMKLSNFLQELLSVLLTPFILIISLPRSAAAIVDFFREFTVHVDGIGYVCSFAVFDFKRQGKVRHRHLAILELKFKLI
jgi:autophagy-related protein 9